MDGGLCQDVDALLVLLPEPGDEIAEAAARKLCNACVIRPDCLAYALTMQSPDDGIWGGLTAAERDRFIRPRS